MEGTFKDWLADALGRHNVSQRELARRLADKSPEDNADAESFRRNIGRILAGAVSPTQRTREAIQEALEDWSGPSVDDEERDSGITREMVLDETRRLRRNLARLERALVWGETI